MLSTVAGMNTLETLLRGEDDSNALFPMAVTV